MHIDILEINLSDLLDCMHKKLVGRVELCIGQTVCYKLAISIFSVERLRYKVETFFRIII